MFAYAPVMIANAPYESTMLLIQKIMYFHAPSGMVMLISGRRSAGLASAVFLFRKSRAADHVALAAAELTAVYGVIVLLSGPLWARKAWGVWWVWDARLTMAFVGWLIALAYLVVRKYGGPGSEKLAAGLALFGAANVPFIYMSVNIWRTIHPQTTVAPTLPAGDAGAVLVLRRGVFPAVFLAADARACASNANAPRWTTSISPPRTDMRDAC